MQAPTRYLIHLAARHSNWQRTDIARTLAGEVYADAEDWRSLLHYLLLGAGAAFLLSGIFFFFAYNWVALAPAVKIGCAVGSFAVAAFGGLFAPLPAPARRVVLTAAVALIGAVLGVLGQVYQTGANAYDFFLGWALLSLPWIAVLGYAPLWLLFTGLVNVTFIMYTQQLGIELSYLVSGMLLFAFNLLIWLFLWARYRQRTGFDWLLRAVAGWAVLVATVNVSAGAFDERPVQLLLTTLFAAAVYAGWVLLGLRERSVYYLALTGGGSLITLTFLLLRWATFANAYLLAGGVLLVGVTLLTQQLNRLNRRWRAE
ncbi:DUF2157 domain-containing protein [Lewinella sp. IMCC34183]|uniref:DUF2157 domain-containing protein n=1 Tax=Lewinella sp. IMCC34183 TaxID=2248762 RepID=UPI000E220AAC|nr:DUF2157 domain-containing protein [Lewinella sp. IMCC34183]